MIKLTIFDPKTGEMISRNECSHEHDLPFQAEPGQGYVMGWKPDGWVCPNDEGLVRRANGTYYSRGAAHA